MSQSCTSNEEIQLKQEFINKFQGVPVLKFPVAPSSFDETNVDDTYATTQLLLEDDLFGKIKLWCDVKNIKISSFLIATFKSLLQRYSGHSDILIAQLLYDEAQISDFQYFKGIRTQPAGETLFADLLNQVEDIVKNKCAEIPSEALNRYILSDIVDPKAFQTFFVYQDETDLTSAKQEALNESVKKLFAKFESLCLTFICSEVQLGLQLTAVYNKKFIGQQFAERINGHFVELLSAIIDDTSKNIGEYNLLTPAEWQQMVLDFNATEAYYPEEKRLFDLFEEQVKKTPDNIALIKGSKQISYSELNKRANSLAHFLIHNGVSPEDNIGLLVTRDFEMIIGMLAILKAGGAYVPIDPDYPVERQQYIFKQSDLKMVIADMDYPLKNLIGKGEYLKINSENPSEYDDTDPRINVNPQQLAYTIYTSGSTGRPKGVMIEHTSAVNLVLWVNQTYNIGGDDRLLFITSMCFDLSVYDIFGMLAAGGALVIAEQKEIQNVTTLQKMMVEHQITFWDSVPTTLDYLVRNLEQEQQDYRYHGLKTVFLSGDWIPVDLPERIKYFLPQANVISLGGATEGTVWSNFYPVEYRDKDWKSIPYGRPITNNFFYILNEQLMPVPLNVAGDLYIGGVGVARGYAGDLEKTNAAFVSDPFNSNLGGRMYKTGDLGRMSDDLNMEFIGRKDNQVKIQGFRIELGEVESVLNDCSLVRNAVVLAKNDAEGKKRLIGYVVSNGVFDKTAIVSFMKTRLPDYMIPVIWIELERLPLTANGKIDRNNLPDAEHIAAAKTEPSTPATSTEIMLTPIWQECMKRPNLGTTDNFFEQGGHSLMAVQIISKIERITGRRLQLSILFKYPTVKGLAAFLDQGENDFSNYSSLVPIKPNGFKTPLYIIHGEGLNVLNFNTLASFMDADQPVFGLQAKGLNGVDEPFDSLHDITKHYLDEMIMHNPNGPYLLAGYSFGGYVAVEMRRQLTEMGKDVRILIMLDTNAEKTEYKDWYALFPQKVKRNLPKLFTFIKTSINQPITTIRDQRNIIVKKIKAQKGESKLFYQQINKIKEKHLFAFRNYQMNAFDDKVYLFKAKICVHYVDDTKYLGWAKYAKKGVELVEVPGDHLSMLLSPNVEELSRMIQKALDNSYSN